jgi:hypothetical protein
MRTTLNLDDHLLRAARKRAAEEDSTLTAVIEQALRRHLEPVASAPSGFRLELLTKRGRLLPGVDVDDRDSLYERMEGRA